MRFKLIVPTLLLALFLIACKSNNELTMERGIYFYETGNYSEAASQFNKIILRHHSDISGLPTNDIEILAHAYQQLALSQAQLANKTNDLTDKKLHYDNAIKNIKKAEKFAIRPHKREEYRKTYLGILQNANNY